MTDVFDPARLDAIRSRQVFDKAPKPMSIETQRELVEALDIARFFKEPGEDSLTMFERVAAWFQSETGYLRPGKDCPMHDPEVREAAWDKWATGKISKARAALAKARAEMGGDDG